MSKCCSSACSTCFHFGCLDPCGSINIGFDVVNAGDYKLKTDFNGTPIEITRNFAAGEKMIFPLDCLNPNFTFRFTIENPDGEDLILSRGEANYSCFRFTTVVTSCIAQSMFTFSLGSECDCGDSPTIGDIEVTVPPPTVTERLSPVNITLKDNESTCISDILSGNTSYLGIASFDFDLKPINGDAFGGLWQQHHRRRVRELLEIGTWTAAARSVYLSFNMLMERLGGFQNNALMCLPALLPNCTLK